MNLLQFLLPAAALERAEEWAEKREFDIAGTHFRIAKLPPMQAHKEWHALREAITRESPAGKGYAAAILGCPEHARQRAQDALFRHVKFNNSQFQTPFDLAGNEPSAFKDAEPYDVDVVFMRAFCVSFLASLQRLATEFGDLLKINEEPAAAPAPEAPEPSE